AGGDQTGSTDTDVVCRQHATVIFIRVHNRTANCRLEILCAVELFCVIAQCGGELSKRDLEVIILLVTQQQPVHLHTKFVGEVRGDQHLTQHVPVIRKLRVGVEIEVSDIERVWGALQTVRWQFFKPRAAIVDVAESVEYYWTQHVRWRWLWQR